MPTPALPLRPPAAAPAAAPLATALLRLQAAGDRALAAALRPLRP